MTDVRVLLADPHPVARAGVRAVLSALPGLAVVGEAADGPAAAALVARLDPDLVVTEAALPGLAGPALVAGLLAGRPARPWSPGCSPAGRPGRSSC